MPRRVPLILLVALSAIVIVQAQNSSVQVQASPDYVLKEENITVTWKGVSVAYEYDYIALISPPDALKNGGLLGLSNQSVQLAHTWQSGYGQVAFDVINMRQNYVFAYVSLSSPMSDAQVLGVSNVVEVAADSPMGGHLIAGPGQGEMTVVWTSNSSATPQVQYGTAPDQLTQTTNGTWSTYTQADLCEVDFGTQGAPFYWWEPGHIHRVVLSGLAPGQQYYYRFGSSTGGWSDVFSFYTAPALGDAGSRLRVVAIGDMGNYKCLGLPQYNQCDDPAQQTTQGALSALPAELVVDVGDVSYAVGREWVWDQYLHATEPLAAQVPHMTAIGNHDTDWSRQSFRPWWGNYGTDSGGECGVPYWYRFPMPGATADAPWYSFSMGLAHFVFMSTEHNFTLGSPQYAWIEADLRAVNRSLTPWIVFIGHRPMYWTTIFDPIMDALQIFIEPLLHKYRVQLALWGHVHAYERSCPMYRSQCLTQGGTTHALIGNGGRSLSTFVGLPKPWSITRSMEYGWSRFELNATTLEFFFYRNLDQQLVDHFFIHLDPDLIPASLSQ